LFKPIKRWVMDEPGYGRAAMTCVDDYGRLWVVWISWFKGKETVRAAVRDSLGNWGKSFICSTIAQSICSLTLAPWHGGILVAWIDNGDDESSGLKLRHVTSEDDMGKVRLVLPGRRRSFDVALGADGKRFLLAWSVREPGGRRLEASMGDSLENISAAMTLSEGRGLNICPSVAFSDGNAWIAWQHMDLNNSLIRAGIVGDDGFSSSVVELGGGMSGISSSSNLIGDGDGGVWLAWQSDMDPERGPGLVRWIETVHVDVNGRVRAPAASMTGVERRGTGEDQGFESPSIVRTPSGRLVIIGLGSQSLRRQDLFADTWSEREKIESEGWSCRGRHFPTCVVNDGVIVVGRESEGIVVRLLPLAEESSHETPKLGDVQKNVEKTVGSFVVSESRPAEIAGRQVLFGDIHQHTMASDGTGTIAETFQRARTRYMDDIVAVSDHESFLGKRTPPGEWVALGSVADDFYDPGAFVTLSAFEWTGKMHPGPGHKVVYPSLDGGGVFSRDDKLTDTSAGLIAACERTGAIAIPHHVGWTGADMDNHDPQVQTCWEIVSCHGAYERSGGGQAIGTRGDDKEGQFIVDALDKGLKFGFVGGSDGHGLRWHHGVCRMEDSHRTGLTAVFAEEATRSGVLNAIARRRCYATSGAKIRLWFEVNDATMGEEISALGTNHFRVIVEALAPIKSLSLVSNKAVETRLEAFGLSADVQGILPSIANGEWRYYFVRIEQTDGHVAWSSPIWIEAAPNSQDGRLTA